VHGEGARVQLVCTLCLTSKLAPQVVLSSMKAVKAEMAPGVSWPDMHRYLCPAAVPRVPEPSWCL